MSESLVSTHYGADYFCYDRSNDFNHHLFSWSPLCLDNLLTEAGFRVLESQPYIHKWPPLYRYVAAIGGRFGFEMACRIWDRLARHWFQVRAIAERPI